MDLVESERREPVKKIKGTAFILVMALLIAADLGKGNKYVDRISHATVIAFMGTRIFFRNI